MAEPQDIATAARCWECIPRGMQQAVLLYVFNQIRVLQGGSDMTPQEVVTAAKCFECIPPGYRDVALLYLADAIVANGASDFTYTRSAVDPVAAPPTANAQHYNTVSQVLWQWDGTAWV